MADVRTERVQRKIALVAFDLVGAVSAILLAFVIRFAVEGRTIPVEFIHSTLNALPILAPAIILVYFACGLYSQLWAHASILELLRIVLAVTLDSLVVTIVMYLLPHPPAFPRSVLVISWFLKVATLGSIRLTLRLQREWGSRGQPRPGSDSRVLIFGAGDAGAMLAREYAKHPELGCTVVGFVDDDLHKQGYRIAGKPVMGTRAQLEEVVRSRRVTHLVIAVPSVKGSVAREVVEAGRRLGVQLQTLPGLFELMNGTVSVSQVRDVQIEDLLGREEVKVDLASIASYLTGQTVLVTGAGGSIGSELCRQVARFSPRTLILLGHGENSIYEIHMELQRTHSSLTARPIIADVQDEARIRRIFEIYRPDVVFHAAAHKHVPLMESNPEEAIKNNVFGTLNLARAADSFQTKRFVLISSDKAVNPTSVMGASKRGAEYVIQSLARSSRTVFVAVRFGNVLGSRGSVIPLFKRQIAAGSAVTVTDPRMLRYFMTIPEASQLVIQAAAMGTGGEIFLLDMGKPVRIVDLARDLIRLSGLEPDVDIPIVYTGVRDGEKLYEELLTAEEGTVATMHERIFVARGDSVPPHVLQGFLEGLRTMAAAGQATNQRVLLHVEQVASGFPLRDAVRAAAKQA